MPPPFCDKPRLKKLKLNRNPMSWRKQEYPAKPMPQRILTDAGFLTVRGARGTAAVSKLPENNS
jgi:hypothetical protein